MANLFRMGLSTGNLLRFYPFAVALEQCLYVVLLLDSFLFVFGCISSVCFMYVGAGFDPPAKLACWLHPRI